MKQLAETTNPEERWNLIVRGFANLEGPSRDPQRLRDQAARMLIQYNMLDPMAPLDWRLDTIHMAAKWAYMAQVEEDFPESKAVWRYLVREGCVLTGENNVQWTLRCAAYHLLYPGMDQNRCAIDFMGTAYIALSLRYIAEVGMIRLDTMPLIRTQKMEQWYLTHEPTKIHQELLTKYPNEGTE